MDFTQDLLLPWAAELTFTRLSPPCLLEILSATDKKECKMESLKCKNYDHSKVSSRQLEFVSTDCYFLVTKRVSSPLGGNKYL